MKKYSIFKRSVDSCENPEVFRPVLENLAISHAKDFLVRLANEVFISPEYNVCFLNPTTLLVEHTFRFPNKNFIFIYYISDCVKK